MASDSNATGTLINILSTVAGGLVLGALGRMLKILSDFRRTQQIHGEALRAIIGWLRDYGFKLPPRIDNE